MDEFLPGCPSRAEFLASDDGFPSTSMDSDAKKVDFDEEINGNAPIIFYSSDFEQALLDRFLPGCPTRSEFMNEGSSLNYAEDVNADFTPNDSTDCSSSSSSSTSTPSPQVNRVLTTINGLANGLRRLNHSTNGQRSGKIRRRGHRGGSKKQRRNVKANKENRIRII